MADEGKRAKKGIENLKPQSVRTKDEQRRIAQKGGEASGEARREKRRIRDALDLVLKGIYEVDGKQLDGYTALAVTMVKEGLSGNVQAFKEIRDSIGEKPTETKDVSLSGGVAFNGGGLGETLALLKKHKERQEGE